ncbi:MAG TPA: asparagine synthase (glutamine-hydrolyzing), partial [Saprospiraceae bacterium]|nr:asparagine synthase (glutamine-hydrolyzing) [Saprospiraceae bacterium]
IPMCGISGIIHHPDGSAVIQRMTGSIAHRGPDAEGFFLESGVALGHRRLSIIDLSEAANQPMADAGRRYVLVFNGEIYNHRSVRSMLPDYVFRTQSDSETLLAAYARWGEGCLQHLNGMFAFAIWDRAENSLFIARDRLGIKPLYYFQHEDYLLFASEIRSLLSSGLVPKCPDSDGVAALLNYQAPIAPGTVVADVKQLMPGHFAKWHQGQMDIQCWWNLAEPRSVPPEASDRRAVLGRIRDLFFEAVEMRLLADVPLGAFLSGGIDSSAVVAAMSELSSTAVNTCSIVFDEKAYDESLHSRAIARQYHTAHQEILLKPDDFLAELPAALAAMDSPSGDGPNTYLVSKHTRQAGLKVALSGLGGDELFAGYSTFLRWYRMQTRWDVYWQLPALFRSFAPQMLAMLKNQERRYTKLTHLSAESDTSIAGLYPYFRQVFLEDELQEIFSPADAQQHDPVRRWLSENKATLLQMSLLSQFSVAEIGTYTQNVLLRDTDQMSMAHALEVREPFFDYRLVEYMLALPDALKYPHTPKQLLTDALGALLPDSIVHRPKMGFALPWEQWLRRELRSFCHERLQRLGQRPGFQSKAIDLFWQRFLAEKKSVTWSQVWILVALEEWWSKNLD